MWNAEEREQWNSELGIRKAASGLSEPEAIGPMPTPRRESGKLKKMRAGVAPDVGCAGFFVFRE
jgi:hypothetical protein